MGTSKSYHRRVGFLSTFLFLAACESDVAKLQRVEGQMATHCLNEEHYRDKWHEARKTLAPGTDTLARRYWEHHAQCEMLTREYQKIGR